MLAFANVIHLLTHELARLRARRFPLTSIPACSFDRFTFWHRPTPIFSERHIRAGADRGPQSLVGEESWSGGFVISDSSPVSPFRSNSRKGRTLNADYADYADGRGMALFEIADRLGRVLLAQNQTTRGFCWFWRDGLGVPMESFQSLPS